MAKKKHIAKAKEPVRLRIRDLKDGNKSLYLDTYHNGTRTREFLKLYLVPETDETAKMRNTATMRAANAIKAQRIIELTDEAAGIKKATSRSKMLLVDWLRHYAERKRKAGQSESFANLVERATQHIIRYGGDSIMLKDIDKDYCLGFIEYLKALKHPDGRPYSLQSAKDYFSAFNCALTVAVKDDIIPFNPCSKIGSDQRIKAPESTREFLSVEEIRMLMNAECQHATIKGAFLFSCFCGLRYSDVAALTWGDIQRDGEKQSVKITMQKTRKTLYLPLSEEAVRWMPKQGEKTDTDKVFDFPSCPCVCRSLAKWAKRAGITKHVTFHTGRHTFATLMLTLGADLYTTSKLLGHTNVKTTQIYAKIVDRKKEEAVNLVNNLFSGKNE